MEYLYKLREALLHAVNIFWPFETALAAFVALIGREQESLEADEILGLAAVACNVLRSATVELAGVLATCRLPDY